MIATGIAAADQFKRANLGLSDQAYYDRFVAPYGREKYKQAVGEGGAMERGAKLRQGQIVSSHFGGRPTSLGDAATSSMAPSFRKLMRGVEERAQADVDRFGAAKMMGRKQDVAAAKEKIAITNKMDAALWGLVPYAGPFISAGVGAAGTALQAGMSADIARLNKRPLRTMQFADPSYAEGSGPSVSPGGGGLYDLYNLIS